jgi:hypothetical protein
VGKRGGEFNQDLMYACVDVSQWNLFLQLIHADKKSVIFLKNSTGKWTNEERKNENKINIKN